MHKEIFKKFHSLSDLEWIDLLFQSVDTQVINKINFPRFPEENVQISMIGNCGKNALHEPKNMFQEIRRIAKQQNKVFNRKTTLLDFACGFGRNTRFFMKDIHPGNLYGSDVRPDFIDICRSTFSYGKTSDVIFDLNNPFPPLRYKAETFDIIMAYSLFSHLSEKAHLAWLSEYFRILKHGGLLFLTIRQQFFLTNLGKNIGSNKIIDKYELFLYEKMGGGGYKIVLTRVNIFIIHQAAAVN
jgi:SAM-dependent methyltransferase